MFKYISISLVLIIVFLAGCTSPSSNSILGKEKINEFTGLKKFERQIKFPTYAPFTVDQVQIKLEYLGPDKVENGKVIKIEKDNLKYQVIQTVYVSKEAPKIVMEVKESDSSISSIKSFAHYDEDNFIKFKNGLKGYYYFNGYAQMFSWEEKGVTYNISISTASKEETKEEVISKKEIIDIAESFENY